MPGLEFDWSYGGSVMDQATPKKQADISKLPL